MTLNLKKTGWLGLVAVCLLSVVLVGCGKKEAAGPDKREAATTPAKGGVTQEVAVMPGADLVIGVDLAGARSSSIYAKLKAMKEENESLNGDNDLAKFEEVVSKLSETTGLDSDDFASFLIAADLANVDFAADEPPDMTQLNLVAAIQLSKAMPLDKLEAAMQEAAKEDGNEKLLSRTTYNGVEILEARTPVEEGEDEKVFYATMIGDDKVALVGSKPGIEGAIDRSKSGVVTSLEKEIDPAISGIKPDTQLFVLFAAPAALQEMLKTQAAAKQDGNPGSMEANFATAMQGFKGLAVGVNMTDVVAFELNSVLGSETDATQVKTLMDGTVLGMLQFGLTMMTGGKPLPVMQSLKTEVKPNSVMSLSFKISEEDVNVMAEVAAQQAAKTKAMEAQRLQMMQDAGDDAPAADEDDEDDDEEDE